MQQHTSIDSRLRFFDRFTDHTRRLLSLPLTGLLRWWRSEALSEAESGSSGSGETVEGIQPAEHASSNGLDDPLASPQRRRYLASLPDPRGSAA